MTLMTSVSGIRGLVGQTMTPPCAMAAGSALAAFAGPGLVVVGRDSRPSGEMVRAALISGLLAAGCEVVDVGIVPTPTTAVMVTERAAVAGVVITASHNPAPWNGIKFLTAEGLAPPPPVARQILDHFHAGKFRYAPVEALKRLTVDEDAVRCHVDRVLAVVDPARIRRRRFRVVLDSVHGAGGAAGRMLLDALGCDLVHLYAEPTGAFPHTPEPTAENLTELCRQTAAECADVGFAQDPDADRLALVDETGTYIGEEYTLAIAARQVLATRPGLVATNLSTSRMIDDLAAAAGAPAVVRTAVGEANVVDGMRLRKCVFGGEGNGGVIDPRVVYVRDSLTAMALVLQAMVDDDSSLGGLVSRIPRYTMIKQKFDCTPGEVPGVLDAVRASFATASIDATDGLRIDGPAGWVHIRPSNTEPVIRVIAEAAERAAAEELIARVRAVTDQARG